MVSDKDLIVALKWGRDALNEKAYECLTSFAKEKNLQMAKILTEFINEVEISQQLIKKEKQK